jgi:hypothetical protein
MTRRAETFSRVIKVLDSVPGIWYDYQVYWESPLRIELVWGPKGNSSGDGMRITEEGAKKITDEELAELEMVLTFGGGV